MTEHYFVEVIADNGAINRWEALTKEQADFIHNEQVVINGSENCTTGKIDESIAIRELDW